MAHSRFIARSIATFLATLEHAAAAEDLARADGFLQRLDPRVKLVGLFALLIAAVAARHLWIVLAIFFLAVALAVASCVPIRTLLLRAWLPVFLFTGVIALPAIFLTSGKTIAAAPLQISEQGLRTAAFLISRAETAATLALLLVLSTPWMQLLKALRFLGLPAVFIVILGMTNRYIFLLLRSAQEFFEARRSRLVGALHGSQRWRLAAANAGVLLSKSIGLSGDVYGAMQSRGFRGDVYALKEFKMQRRDWIALAFFLAVASIFFGIGWQ